RRVRRPAAEIATVYESLGDVAEVSGQYERAAAAYRTARRMAGDRPLALVDLFRKEGWLRERSGRYSDALRWYTRGTQMLAGRDAATALFREALRVWRASRFPVGIALATSNLGRVAIRAGDDEEGRRRLAEAREGFRLIGAERYVLETDAREAERLLLVGR